MLFAALRHIRRNLVSYLALFVTLGGTSYAAVKLPRNSVGSAQLENNAVTSRKVRDHSLLARDFRAHQLPAGPQGQAGPAGPQGARGPAGGIGRQGSRGAAGSRRAARCDWSRRAARCYRSHWLTGARRAGGRAVQGAERHRQQQRHYGDRDDQLPAGKWLLTGHVVADNSSSTAAAEPDCTIGTVGPDPIFSNAKAFLPLTAATSSRRP